MCQINFWSKNGPKKCDDVASLHFAWMYDKWLVMTSQEPNKSVGWHEAYRLAMSIVMLILHSIFDQFLVFTITSFIML